MRASIELLPRYYDELLRCWRRGAPLADSIQAGVEAERRMTRAIHSNAHKGYIFLSGLLLMAACRCAGGPGLREAIAELARACAAQAGAVASHGAELRQRLGLGGVRAEAESGLPAVFEQGWPHYREALAAGWEPDQARFQLLAVLMQRVEDSTAVSRCGLDGLARLRRDGAELQGLLERQRDPEPRLAELNQDYQGSGLTMGGVADCLALTLALQAAVG
jgi:triphosphoribosyl-dephospho-CoA synthase